MKRFVFFVSGLARITLPAPSTVEVWIQGGKYGLIYADDTAAVSARGHRTEYLSGADTVALTAPIGEGVQQLKHVLLHGGPCTGAEVAGI